MMDHHTDNRDDTILVALALAGDRGAFEVLLLRYYPSVIRLCQRLLGNTPEAQDVAQEAALQAFLALAQLQDPARFGAWLHAIAANLARMALRRRRAIPLIPLSEDAHTALLSVDIVPTPEDAYAARETHDAIVAALQELATLQRDALVGFYLAGYSYAELAELLRVPLSTIKWRLFDGRRQLRRSLQPLAQELLPLERRQRKEPAMDTPDLVEMSLEFVGRGLTSNDPERLVMLREPSSGERLPLHMLAAEGDAIGSALDEQQPRRPFPHDLTLRLLTASGVQVQRVVVRRLIEGVFYAEITLAQGEQQHTVEARLSDALALAVRANAPLYVTRALFEATSFDPQNRQQARERASQALQRYHEEYPSSTPPPPVPAPAPLEPVVLQQIDACLERLLRDTGGQIALLIHGSGTPVAWKGPVVTEYLVPYAQALIGANPDLRHTLAMQLVGGAGQEVEDADVLFRFGRVAEQWDLQLFMASDGWDDPEGPMNQRFLQAVRELQALLPDQPSSE